MRIVSWNVNGIRAAVKKGFCSQLNDFQADIVGLQETKAHVSQALEACREIDGYHRYAHAARRPGYSGVMVFCKTKPHQVVNSLGLPQFDDEGRFLALQFNKFWLINCYFPNGSGKNGDNSRVPYKLSFYDALFDFLEAYPGPKLIMGDFNTAHKEIDLARPKDNVNTSGFLPIEREHFNKTLNRGYIDTFRHFNQEPHHYTWWNMRFRARERNIGWRIDGVLASKDAISMVSNAFIWQEVLGSDHCPVGVELSLN
jgi:exodeoxyribonuclease-3